MDSYIVNFLSLGHSFELLALTLLQEKKKETFPNKKLKDIDKIVPSKGTSFDEFFNVFWWIVTFSWQRVSSQAPRSLFGDRELDF